MSRSRKKKEEFPSSKERWMGLALWYASASKNGSGAVIVDSNYIPISAAFDYCPHGLEVPRHAEKNAISNVNQENLEDAVMYVTHFPCEDCLIEIAAVGIRRVIYLFSEDDSGNEFARKIPIITEKFMGNLNWMRDYMSGLEDISIF